MNGVDEIKQNINYNQLQNLSEEMKPGLQDELMDYLTLYPNFEKVGAPSLVKRGVNFSIDIAAQTLSVDVKTGHNDYIKLQFFVGSTNNTTLREELLNYTAHFSSVYLPAMFRRGPEGIGEFCITPAKPDKPPAALIFARSNIGVVALLYGSGGDTGFSLEHFTRDLDDVISKMESLTAEKLKADYCPQIQDVRVSNKKLKVDERTEIKVIIDPKEEKEIKTYFDIESAEILEPVLVEEASALYKAKSSGRSKIVVRAMDISSLLISRRVVEVSVDD